MHLGVFEGKDYPLVSALKKKAWLPMEMFHLNFSWFTLRLQHLHEI